MSTPPPNDNASIKEVSPDNFVDSSGHQLDKHQVRAVVTPHVFAVAPELIGKPLAKPARRGFAMLLDGIIIALLTSGSFLFVLPVAAYLAFGCHKLHNMRRRNIVIACGALLLVLLPMAPQAVKDGDDNKVAAAMLVAARALALTNASCDAECAAGHIDNITVQLRGTNLSDAEVEAMVKDLLDKSTLSEEQQQTELANVMRDIRQYRQRAANNATAELAKSVTQPHTELSLWQSLQRSDHSVLLWLQGILADLGIGFGWAIGYFTLFISWNNGQTIGKKLLGMRVVQLDNTPLSLWASFGRQGGYSAGFATGLLGFFQIYWDPNRQAIQDKVADTLVLRV